MEPKEFLDDFYTDYAWKCTGGHDLCHTVHPCSECPHCQPVDPDKKETGQ